MSVLLYFVLAWIAGLFIGWTYEPFFCKIPILLIAISTFVSCLLMLAMSWRDNRKFPSGLLLIIILGLLSGIAHMIYTCPSGDFDTNKPKKYKGEICDIKEWGSWCQVNVIILDEVHDDKMLKSRYHILLKVHKSKLEENLSVGDLLIFNANLKVIPGRDNLSGFNERGYWAGMGIRYCDWLEPSDILQVKTGAKNGIRTFINGIRIGITNKIDGLNLSINNKSILLAMLTGNKEKLTKDDKEQFSRLGIMHLLAVSGLHAGLIFIIFSKMFSLMRISEYSLWNKYLSSSLVWIYVIICGLPASAIRAAAMISLHVISKSFNRSVAGVHIVFFVAFIHTLIQPYAIFSAGFQLSYLAVLGILIFFPKIQKSVPVKNPVLAKIRDLATLSLSAQALTFPISIFIFASFPAWFLFANVILMPIGLLIFYLGLGLLTFAGIGFNLLFLDKILDVLMTFWMGLGEKISNLPGSLLVFEDYPWMFLAMYVGIILLSSQGIKKLLLRPYSLLILFVIWSLYSFLIAFCKIF